MTTKIPTTPAEITAARLARIRPHTHTGYNGIIPATRTHTTPSSLTMHIDCDCFACKRERVETDQ